MKLVKRNLFNYKITFIENYKRIFKLISHVAFFNFHHILVRAHHWKGKCTISNDIWNKYFEM